MLGIPRLELRGLSLEGGRGLDTQQGPRSEAAGGVAAQENEVPEGEIMRNEEGGRWSHNLNAGELGL